MRFYYGEKNIILIAVCIMIIVVSNLYYQSTQLPISVAMDGVIYNREENKVIGQKSMEFNGTKTKEWLPWLKDRLGVIKGQILLDDGVYIDISFFDFSRGDSSVAQDAFVEMGPSMNYFIVYYEPGILSKKTKIFDMKDTIQVIWVFSKDGYDKAVELATGFDIP